MAAEFTNISSGDGFDGAASPPFQMVPKSGAKLIYLTDGAGLVVTSADTSKATVMEVPVGVSPLMNARQFVVMGIAAGNTTIEARPNRPGPVAVVATLAVSVKNLKRIKTTFHLVKDSATPVHQTTRTRGNVDTLVTFANRILLPQANVQLDKHSVKDTTVPGNLGSVVRYSSHIAGVPAAQHEWDDVVALRDNTADFNVFFVWDYEQDNSPGTDNANAGTKASEMNCLLEDPIAVPGRTLAHETVHALGVHAHSADSDNLMSAAPSVAGRGEQMNKAQINAANP